VSFAEGALLEPLSVAMHGINTARLYLGRPVLICGAGPIGLIALAAARASGCHPIVITDVDAGRLEFARGYVPSCKTYLVSFDLDAQGNAKEIRNLYGGGEYEAPDVVSKRVPGVQTQVAETDA